MRRYVPERGLRVSASVALALALAGCDVFAGAVVRQAKEAVSDELRDASSAKFSDVQRCGNTNIVSGKVNAKNAYGAYSGDIDFYVEGHKVVFITYGDSEASPVSDKYALLHQYSSDDDTEIIRRCSNGISAGSNASSGPGAGNSDINAMAVDALAAADAALANAGEAVLPVTEEDVAAAARAVEAAEVAPETERSAPDPADLCYKDYCPCEPPQGGPDQILCDQLEEGMEVAVESLIAGRGMREARRQMEEMGY